MGVNATGTLDGSQVERRRRENRGTVGGEGVESGEGLCPFPKKYDFFISKWCDENDSNLRYSKVPLKGKNKPLVKIFGGVVNTERPLQVKYWKITTPATPAALTPMLFAIHLLTRKFRKMRIFSQKVRYR